MADDLLGTGHDGAEQRVQSDAAETEHCDLGAREHLRRIEHGADPSEYGAAEQRRFVEREVFVDFHHGAAIHHAVLGKSGNAHVVINLLVMLVQAHAGIEQLAGTVGLLARLAAARMAFDAGDALAATRREHERHVVANF